MKKLIILAVLSVFFITGCKSDNNNNNDAGSTSVNFQKISSLRAINIPEFEKILAEQKGKMVIVNFFGSWCPPCKAETPGFVKIYEEYKDKDFVIIGIAVDKNAQDAVKFVNNYNVTYPVYQATQELLMYFQINPIPASFIFDRNGKPLDKIIGYMDESIVIQVAKYKGE